MAVSTFNNVIQDRIKKAKENIEHQKSLLVNEVGQGNFKSVSRAAQNINTQEEVIQVLNIVLRDVKQFESGEDVAR